MSSNQCPNCAIELDRQPVNTIAKCPRCGQLLQQMFDGSLQIVQPNQPRYRTPRVRNSNKDSLYGFCCCILIVVGWLFAFFYLGIFFY